MLQPFLFEGIPQEGFNRLFHSHRLALSQIQVLLPFSSRCPESCPGVLGNLVYTSEVDVITFMSAVMDHVVS